MRERIRLVVEIACALITLILGGLAVNAGSSSARWPGVLDLVRRYPWWAILGVAVLAVATEVATRLKKRPRPTVTPHRESSSDPSTEERPEATNTKAEPILPEMVELFPLMGLKNPYREAIERRWNLSEASTNFEAMLGVGVNGEHVRLNLLTNGPSGLICGHSGAGTSEAMRTIVFSLAVTYPPSRFRLHYLDVRGTNWCHDFDKLPHLVSITSVSSAAREDPAVLKRVLTGRNGPMRYLDDKIEILRGSDDATFELYNRSAPPNKRLPLDLLVVDEFYDRSLSGVLAEIARTGRAAGFGVLAVCPVLYWISPQLRIVSRFVIALGRAALEMNELDVQLSEGEQVSISALTSKWIPGRGVMVRSGAELTVLQVATGNDWILDGYGHPARNPDFDDLLASFPLVDQEDPWHRR